MAQPEKNTLETILVVEDQPIVLEAVCSILERAGFRVLSAANSAAAMRVEGDTRGTIHLLLSDVIMPGMSGPDMARLLEKKRPDMRVMLMSGYQEDEMLSFTRGWRFMEKPFLSAQLIQRVNEVLHTSECSQTNSRSYAPGA